jgi:hypothetical protein
MNDFLYVAGTVLEYLSLKQTLGMDIEDIISELMQDIPEDVLRLIEENEQTLRRFFKNRSYDDFLMGWDELNTDPEIPADADMPGEPPPPGGPLPPAKVTGIWQLESDPFSIWEFREDGRLSIGTQSPVAAEVLGFEGTYTVRDGIVSIKLDKPHPYPKTFRLLSNRMEGEDDALIRHR